LNLGAKGVTNVVRIAISTMAAFDREP